MPKSENDNRKGRPINLPPEVWSALDAEAKDKKRSATKQLEVILSERYGLGGHSLDSGSILIEIKEVGRLIEKYLQMQKEEKGEAQDRDVQPPPDVKKKKIEPIIEQNNFLMSDSGGANAGTKRLPTAIRKDIADAKAHARGKLGKK